MSLILRCLLAFAWLNRTVCVCVCVCVSPALQAEGDDKDSVGSLRAQLKAAQSEAAQHLSARQAAEERLTLMNLEISKLRHENQVLISKLVPNHQGVINAQIAQLAAVAAGGAGVSAD